MKFSYLLQALFLLAITILIGIGNIKAALIVLAVDIVLVLVREIFKLKKRF